MQYLRAFHEGITTFISPCFLPMIPIYVSYFVGGGERTTSKTIKVAIGFVFGFTIIFVMQGVLAGTVGSFIREYKKLFNYVSGWIIMIFGLNFLEAFKFNQFDNILPSVNTNMFFFSSVFFGMVFSFYWAPSVGSLLGSALMLATLQPSIIEETLILFLYSLGMSIPFVSGVVLIDYLKGKFHLIKRNYEYIISISGIILVIAGILMFAGMI